MVEGAANVSFSYNIMFCWGVTVIVLMATYVARIVPKYRDCEGIENYLQCFSPRRP